MKKKWIYLIILIFIVLSILVVVSTKKEYTIRIDKIDSFSPDKKITVLENNKKIKYKSIEYLDGTILCEDSCSVISDGDIGNEKELKIVLKSDKTVIAKIIEGDELE